MDGTHAVLERVGETRACVCELLPTSSCVRMSLSNHIQSRVTRRTVHASHSRLEAWKVPSCSLRLRRGFVGAFTHIQWQIRSRERSIQHCHSPGLSKTNWRGLHIEPRYFLRSDAIENGLRSSVPDETLCKLIT